VTEKINDIHRSCVIIQTEYVVDCVDNVYDRNDERSKNSYSKSNIAIVLN